MSIKYAKSMNRTEKEKHFTKKGPGRVHRQGKPKFGSKLSKRAYKKKL